MSDMMEKVRHLRSHYPELNIEVDGGVGPDNINTCAAVSVRSTNTCIMQYHVHFSHFVVFQAGANMIVSGTALMTASLPGEVMNTMRQAVHSELQKKKNCRATH